MRGSRCKKLRKMAQHVMANQANVLKQLPNGMAFWTGWRGFYRHLKKFRPGIDLSAPNLPQVMPSKTTGLSHVKV